MAKEFERKALLTEGEYARLLSAFSEIAEKKRYTQKNTYYDDEAFFLAKSRRTLRVREKSGALALEYKYGQTESGDLRVATEYTLPLEAYPEEIEAGTLPEALPSLCFRPLGTLVTERCDFQVGNSLVSLDKNEYLGYTDYEIEVESETVCELPDEVAAIYSDFRRPIIGKFHRFLARLLGHA